MADFDVEAKPAVLDCLEGERPTREGPRPFFDAVLALESHGDGDARASVRETERGAVGALAVDLDEHAAPVFPPAQVLHREGHEACIAERVSYLDLADGSEFVAGVKALERYGRSP